MKLSEFAQFVFGQFKGNPAKIIAIDGSLCSGKSTLAEGLRMVYSYNKYDVSLISTDIFLVDRDKRDYQHNKEMKNLYNWYHIEEAHTFLQRFFAGDFITCLEILGYDRNTGRRSKRYSFRHMSPRSIVILEGLYSIKMLKDNSIASDLLIFCKVSELIGFERMKKRSTYIPFERFKFEFNNIHIPSLKRYQTYLKNEQLVFDYIIETADFNNVKYNTKVTL